MNLSIALRQPFKRWSLRTHACVAGVLLTALLLFGWALLHQQNQSLQTSQLTLRMTQTQLLKLQHNQQAGALNFTQTLPPAGRTDEVVADINTRAQELGVQISSLSITAQKATTSELGTVQFTLSLNGEYRASKALLAALLDRYASLGLQSLSMRDMPNMPSRQETQLVLVLFVKN